MQCNKCCIKFRPDDDIAVKGTNYFHSFCVEQPDRLVNHTRRHARRLTDKEIQNELRDGKSSESYGGEVLPDDTEMSLAIPPRWE